MDSLMQIKGIVGDFNVLFDKNKGWVDEVFVNSKDNSISNTKKYTVPRTPMSEKKSYLDELKSSDQGYESFRSSSQNCSSHGFKSHNSSIIPTPKKNKQSISTQTDPVIILNKEDCETLQKICKNICRRMSVEHSRIDFSDEVTPSLSDATSTSLMDKNVTKFISIFTTSINDDGGSGEDKSQHHKLHEPPDLVPNLPSCGLKPSMPGNNSTLSSGQGHLDKCDEERGVDDLMVQGESNKLCNQTVDVPVKTTSTTNVIMYINPCIKRPEGRNNTLQKTSSKVNCKIFLKESEPRQVGVKQTPANKRRSSRVVVRRSLLSTSNRRRSSNVHFDKKNNLFCSTRWKFFGAKKKTNEVENIVKESSSIKQAPFRDTSNSGLSNFSKESYMSAIPRMPSKSKINQLQKLFSLRTRTDLDKIASNSKPLTNLPLPRLKIKTPHKPVNATHARANTLVKCISGRRSSIVDPIVGTKQFLRQEQSAQRLRYKPIEKLSGIPCKTPMPSKIRKDEIMKVGLKSAPSKNKNSCERSKGKKTSRAEASVCLLPNSSLKSSRMTFFRSESPCENYDISDLKSDDEGHSLAPKTRKRIPSWATGKQLISSLMKFYLNPVDVEEIFGTIFAPDLNEMFVERKPRFDCRSSSANWEVPLTMAPGSHRC